MFNLKGYGLQLICYSLLLLLIKFGAFTSAAEHQQHDTEQDVISMRDLQKSASNAPHESGKYMLAVVLLGVVPFVGVLLIAGVSFSNWSNFQRFPNIFRPSSCVSSCFHKNKPKWNHSRTKPLQFGQNQKIKAQKDQMNTKKLFENHFTNTQLNIFSIWYVERPD